MGNMLHVKHANNRFQSYQTTLWAVAMLLGIFCFIGSANTTAHAASIKIRTGEHEKYSRLVFDWPTKIEYAISKPAQETLQITFQTASAADLSAIAPQQNRNIADITQTAADPLTLTVKIPSTSRHRSFYAGNKIVLDIYNPEGGTPALKTAAAPPPPMVEPKTIAAPAPTQDTLKDPSPAEMVKADTKTAHPVTPVEQKPLEKFVGDAPSTPDLITVSSTQSIGLAVFERGGRIWIVNDQENLRLTPQVSGPNAEKIGPLQQVELTGASAFVTNTSPDNFTQVKGGGLLWKIIMSDFPNKMKAVLPKREGVITGTVRSGKLIWPFSDPGKLIEMQDPITGVPLKIVTVKSAKDFAGPAQSFVDFDILPASIGLVIAPKIDGITVTVIKGQGVEVTGPNGLVLLPEDVIQKQKEDEKKKQIIAQNPIQKDDPQIFDFDHWRLGGLNDLAENQSIMLAGIKDLTESSRDENMMTLAKMYLSNAMGAEALGFLNIIAAQNPEIAKTPEFRALRGAAKALDYKTEDAFTDLSMPELNAFEEISFWKAYALADLGDWQQAIDTMPKNASALQAYPELILNRIGLVAAEIALRSGNVGMAEDILGLVDKNQKTLRAPQKAALAYLRGESARQDGDIENTKRYWEPLATGPDDLYRARAGLALTRLQVADGSINLEQAVDNLERLRYAWRGDELEGQINYWLGQTYFEDNEFVKGLNIMREAASFTAGTKLGDRITKEMGHVFMNLYLSKTLDTMSPLDAVALYEQFSELIPADDRGNQIVDRLAGRLAKADLLGRSADLLDYQLTHRLSGLDAYNTGTKLAAIRLLDEKPDEATTALETAQKALESIPEELQTQERKQTIALLRARALSRQGRPDQALELLNNLKSNTSVNRLRADIAWDAGYWDDAGDALEDVILDQNISLTRPLTDEQSTLILQRGVALNLSNDRIALANMREKFGDAMSASEKSRSFDVITRPRQFTELADRETLMGVVSEVDLFEDFLSTYKTTPDEPSN